MQCNLCGGKLKEKHTQLPFKVSDHSIVIIKGMPVLQCEHCIEYLIEDSVMKKVDDILHRIDMASELEIVRYAA